MSPDPPKAPVTAYEQLGGEAAVRRLVDRFYDRLDTMPQYQVVRGLYPQELSSSREKLFLFLCGWLGGPALYMKRFGHPMLRARHMAFVIGVAERDGWLACMNEAMTDIGVADPLRSQLAAAFFQTADFMRNTEG